MKVRRFAHVVGFDDAPFERGHRGDVLIVGAVYSGERLDGVLSGRVRRDGANATAALTDLIRGSKFAGHLQAVLLQGIAFAGFNVIDIHGLHAALGLPVLVVSRKLPNLETIREALIGQVRGGARKWRLIERAGMMESLRGVYVQRVGLGLEEAEYLVKRFAVHGRLPEPLRVAHLIAGGVVSGESRHRA